VELRLTSEQAALREQATVVAVGLQGLVAKSPESQRQGMPSDGDSREVTAELGRGGWIGMTWPVEAGGRGLSHVDAALVEDVFGYHWLPLSLYLLSYKTVGCALERFGSQELRERLLPEIARGGLVFCQGFSEPDAGSDLAALTSSAWLADWIYLAVRTDPERPRHRAISVLIAPLDTPGIEVRRFPVLGGGFLCEVFLDEVEIPVANLVGELHGGWQVLMGTLDFERVTAEKIGALAWVVDELERHLRADGGLDEHTWGRLMLLRGELAAARLLSLRAAHHLDHGDPASTASAMAKLAGARLAQRLAREALELLGLDGLRDADPEAPLRGRVAALYGASVGSTISGGTAEVQQLVIARRGLGLR